MPLEKRDLFLLENYWREFVNDGKLHFQRVRPVVAERWLACRQGGVNALGAGPSVALEPPELDGRRGERRELLEVAQNYVETLAEFLDPSCAVVLSDEEGYLLAVHARGEARDLAAQLGLAPGRCFAEHAAGNNGLGTALAVGEPVQFVGAEHFCRFLHDVTTAGAPIFWPAKACFGALAVFGPKEVAHAHTLGMVVALVTSTVKCFETHQRHRELFEAHTRLATVVETVGEGLLTFDAEDRLVLMNTACFGLFGWGRERYGKEARDVLPALARLLHQVRRQGDGEFCLRKAMPSPVPAGWQNSPSGEPVEEELVLDGARGPTQFFVRVRPIYYGSAYGGAVVMLRESREVRRLVHRMVGARATFTFRDLVGASPSFRAAVEHARLAVRSEAAVLLEGESGAGKELFAQAIHNEGGRARGPFVAVNCGAIPRELIASELFGYVEGAFTGAARGGRPGKFELADGGTLFLDEIGEMPLDMQVVLLRVLQEKKVVRVGGTQMVPVDVRIIAATNKNLLREVEKGNFRRDLFYRLNIFHIKIPPLRERPGDVTLLARYFLAKRVPAGRKLSFHPRTLKLLESYAWPGNVRELENLIERLVHTVKEGTILPEHLPPEIRGFARETRAQPDLATLERQEVLRALGLCAGNVKQAAASLGIARSTLYRKLRAYEIDPGSFRNATRAPDRRGTG